MVRAVGGGARSALGKLVSCRMARGAPSENARKESRPRPPGTTVRDPPRDALSRGEGRAWILFASLEKKNKESETVPLDSRFALDSVPGAPISRGPEKG